VTEVVAHAGHWSGLIMLAPLVVVGLVALSTRVRERAERRRVNRRPAP
jgi:hypothetical protein